jgi:tetratricopeptide (TPR) repeat protein
MSNDSSVKILRDWRAQLAQDIKKNNYTAQIGIYNYVGSQLFEIHSDFVQSFKCHARALRLLLCEVGLDAADPATAACTCRLLGLDHLRLAHFRESLICCIKSWRISHDFGCSEELFRSSINIGSALFEQPDDDGLDTHRLRQAKYIVRDVIERMQSYISENKNASENAIEIESESESDQSESERDEHVVSTVKTSLLPLANDNLALILTSLGEHDAAIAHLENKGVTHQDAKLQYHHHHGLAQAYMSKRQYGQAVQHLQEADRLAAEHQHRFDFGMSAMHLALAQLRNRQFRDAHNSDNRFLEYAKKANVSNIIETALKSVQLTRQALQLFYRTQKLDRQVAKLRQQGARNSSDSQLIVKFACHLYDVACAHDRLYELSKNNTDAMLALKAFRELRHTLDDMPPAATRAFISQRAALPQAFIIQQSGAAESNSEPNSASDRHHHRRRRRHSRQIRPTSAQAALASSSDEDSDEEDSSSSGQSICSLPDLENNSSLGLHMQGLAHALVFQDESDMIGVRCRIAVRMACLSLVTAEPQCDIKVIDTDVTQCILDIENDDSASMLSSLLLSRLEICMAELHMAHHDFHEAHDWAQRATLHLTRDINAATSSTQSQSQPSVTFDVLSLLQPLHQAALLLLVAYCCHKTRMDAAIVAAAFDDAISGLRRACSFKQYSAVLLQVGSDWIRAVAEHSRYRRTPDVARALSGFHDTLKELSTSVQCDVEMMSQLQVAAPAPVPNRPSSSLSAQEWQPSSIEELMDELEAQYAFDPEQVLMEDTMKPHEKMEIDTPQRTPKKRRPLPKPDVFQRGRAVVVHGAHRRSNPSDELAAMLQRENKDEDHEEDEDGTNDSGIVQFRRQHIDMVKETPQKRLRRSNILDSDEESSSDDDHGRTRPSPVLMAHSLPAAASGPSQTYSVLDSSSPLEGIIETAHRSRYVQASSRAAARSHLGDDGNRRDTEEDESMDAMLLPDDEAEMVKQIELEQRNRTRSYGHRYDANDEDEDQSEDEGDDEEELILMTPRKRRGNSSTSTSTSTSTSVASVSGSASISGRPMPSARHRQQQLRPRFGSRLRDNTQMHQLYKLLELARSQGDEHEESMYCNQIGVRLVHAGDYQRAIEYHKRDLQLSHEQLYLPHRWLAECYSHIDEPNFQLAAQHATASIKYAKRAKDLAEQQSGACTLGGIYQLWADSVYRQQRRTALEHMCHAVKYFEESVILANALDHKHPERAVKLRDATYNAGMCMFACVEMQWDVTGPHAMLSAVAEPVSSRLDVFHPTPSTINKALRRLTKALELSKSGAAAMPSFASQIHRERARMLAWFGCYRSACSELEKAQTTGADVTVVAGAQNQQASVYMSWHRFSDAHTLYLRAASALERHRSSSEVASDELASARTQINVASDHTEQHQLAMRLHKQIGITIGDTSTMYSLSSQRKTKLLALFLSFVDISFDSPQSVPIPVQIETLCRMESLLLDCSVVTERLAFSTQSGSGGAVDARGEAYARALWDTTLSHTTLQASLPKPMCNLLSRVQTQSDLQTNAAIILVQLYSALGDAMMDMFNQVAIARLATLTQSNLPTPTIVTALGEADQLRIHGLVPKQWFQHPPVWDNRVCQLWVARALRIHSVAYGLSSSMHLPGLTTNAGLRYANCSLVSDLLQASLVIDSYAALSSPVAYRTSRLYNAILQHSKRTNNLHMQLEATQSLLSCLDLSGDSARVRELSSVVSRLQEQVLQGKVTTPQRREPAWQTTVLGDDSDDSKDDGGDGNGDRNGDGDGDDDDDDIIVSSSTGSTPVSMDIDGTRTKSKSHLRRSGNRGKRVPDSRAMFEDVEDADAFGTQSNSVSQRMRERGHTPVHPRHERSQRAKPARQPHDIAGARRSWLESGSSFNVPRRAGHSRSHGRNRVRNDDAQYRAARRPRRATRFLEVFGDLLDDDAVQAFSINRHGIATSALSRSSRSSRIGHSSASSSSSSRQHTNATFVSPHSLFEPSGRQQVSQQRRRQQRAVKGAAREAQLRQRTLQEFKTNFNIGDYHDDQVSADNDDIGYDFDAQMDPLALDDIDYDGSDAHMVQSPVPFRQGPRPSSSDPIDDPVASSSPEAQSPAAGRPRVASGRAVRVRLCDHDYVIPCPDSSAAATLRWLESESVMRCFRRTHRVVFVNRLALLDATLEFEDPMSALPLNTTSRDHPVDAVVDMSAAASVLLLYFSVCFRIADAKTSSKQFLMAAAATAAAASAAGGTGGGTAAALAHDRGHGVSVLGGSGAFIDFKTNVSHFEPEFAPLLVQSIFGEQDAILCLCSQMYEQVQKNSTGSSVSVHMSQAVSSPSSMDGMININSISEKLRLHSAVQLKRLCIADMPVTDQQLVPLLYCMSESSGSTDHVQSLDLSRTSISDASLLAFARLLRAQRASCSEDDIKHGSGAAGVAPSFPSLTIVRCAHVQASSWAWKVFVSALAEACPPLHELDLSFTDLDMNCLHALSQLIRGTAPTLCVLKLASISIPPSDVLPCIRPAVRCLQQLDLRFLHWTAATLAGLLDMIRDSKTLQHTQVHCIPTTSASQRDQYATLSNALRDITRTKQTAAAGVYNQLEMRQLEELVPLSHVAESFLRAQPDTQHFDFSGLFAFHSLSSISAWHRVIDHVLENHSYCLATVDLRACVLAHVSQVSPLLKLIHRSSTKTVNLSDSLCSQSAFEALLDGLSLHGGSTVVLGQQSNVVRVKVGGMIVVSDNDGSLIAHVTVDWMKQQYEDLSVKLAVSHDTDDEKKVEEHEDDHHETGRRGDHMQQDRPLETFRPDQLEDMAMMHGSASGHDSGSGTAAATDTARSGGVVLHCRK